MKEFKLISDSNDQETHEEMSLCDESGNPVLSLNEEIDLGGEVVWRVDDYENGGSAARMNYEDAVDIFLRCLRYKLYDIR